MKEIVAIFMKRDKVSKETAVAMYFDLQNAVMDAVANDDLWEIDSVLADYGLEPDYIDLVVKY